MEKKQTSLIKYDISKPEQIQKMANVIKDYVIKNKLFDIIKDKAYVQVDGWQFAGMIGGLEAIIEEPINLSNDKEIKWSCECRLYNKDKIVVSRGWSICSNREEKKKSFDEYAIISMAQTRAIGKAFRNKIGWVMKLAGYESTPAEEIKKETKNNEPTNDLKNEDKINELMSMLKGNDNKDKLKDLRMRTGIILRSFDITSKHATILIAKLLDEDVNRKIYEDPKTL